MTLYTEFST